MEILNIHTLEQNDNIWYIIYKYVNLGIVAPNLSRVFLCPKFYIIK
jgi:hypothetical protein